MTGLLIIFGLSMIVDSAVAYLCIGLALAEFKGIYLPLLKKFIANKFKRTLSNIINKLDIKMMELKGNNFIEIWI